MGSTLPLPKTLKDAMESPARGRGRPPKEDALSGAERARRYREKQKAAGRSKRYVVTVNADPSQAEDLAYWIANGTRIGELLSKANAERDYLKMEVERLHSENDRLLARAKEVERYSTIKEKELMIARQELAKPHGR